MDRGTQSNLGVCVAWVWQELLDEKVRPYLQADGGEVEFVRFDRERGVVSEGGRQGGRDWRREGEDDAGLVKASAPSAMNGRRG